MLNIMKTVLHLFNKIRNYNMSIKITFAFLFVGLIFVSCDKKEELLINGESFTEKNLEMCKDGSCPEITINYISAYGNEKVAEKINKQIEEFIIASLLMGEHTVAKAKTINEAAVGFIDVFKKDKAQFPDMAGDYFAEINVRELSTTATVYSFECRQYLFTGGAHGYGSVAFLNIDAKTGEEITLKKLVKDKKGFQEFAEKQFKNQYKIAVDAPVNSTGFWFKDEKFNLPETAGFTSDSIIFVYNQYDIASYAEGPIELKLSRKEAQPYMNIE